MKIHSKDNSLRTIMKKPSILLIDNDLKHSSMLSVMLEQLLNVIMAQNGKEALSSLNAEPVLVALDPELLDMDGIELLKTIRKKYAAVKVIIITNRNCRDWAVACINLGVNGHFEKTIGHTKLAEEIKKMAGVDNIKVIKILWGEDYQTKFASLTPSVKMAVDYAHLHYQRDFSRDEMADYIGVSCDHLSRLFHKESGWKLKEYSTLFKISKSRELLLMYPNVKVRIVAGWVGFGDPNYFSRLFTQRVGCTCEEFRTNTLQAINPMGGHCPYFVYVHQF